MNELNSKILQEARESVAAKYGYDSWSGEVNGMLTHISNEGCILQRSEEAFIQAMETLTRFHQWAQSKSGYSLFHGFGYWANQDEGYISTEQLYQIWKEANK